MLTERLELRQTIESDRDRFVELFCDDDFMVFAGGVLEAETAHARFDDMLQFGQTLSFAKQPVIEQSSGLILGYCGVDEFTFENESRLEFGYRLVPDARGKGYVTEAGRALLAVAENEFQGEILAMIDPTNQPSQNVAVKLGFVYWKDAVVDGFLDGIYRRTFPA